MNEDYPLKDILNQRIAQQGRITFADFMSRLPL